MFTAHNCKTSIHCMFNFCYNQGSLSMRMDRCIELTYGAWHGTMFLHCLSTFGHVSVPWRWWLQCLFTGQHATVKSSPPSKPQDGLPSPLNLDSRLEVQWSALTKRSLGYVHVYLLYVWTAILNLFHPYLGSTTILIDILRGWEPLNRHTGHRNVILETTDDASWELVVKTSLWTKPYSLCTHEHVHVHVHCY